MRYKVKVRHSNGPLRSVPPLRFPSSAEGVPKLGGARAGPLGAFKFSFKISLNYPEGTAQQNGPRFSYLEGASRHPPRPLGLRSLKYALHILKKYITPP